MFSIDLQAVQFIQQKCVDVRYSRMKVCISKSLYVSEFGKGAVTSTPAENGFFKAHGKLKLEILLHHHTDSEFRHTSKKIFFGGGVIKKLFREILFFLKKGVEIFAFDGVVI